MTSFIGKLLVVLNLVLSLLFMAFAGGVFAVHKTWKDKHATALAQVEAAKKDADLQRTEKEAAAKAKQEEVDALNARVTAAEADKANSAQTIAALTQQNNDLQTKVKQFVAVSEVKTAEAGARLDETTLRRIENAKLREQLDTENADNRKLRDDIFAKDLELKELKERFTSVLNEYGDMRSFVAAKGLQFDRDAIRKKNEPAPKVTGLVTDVKNDRTNRPEFVEISLGSDEGLAVGHKMDVVGSGIGGRKADWLGQIELIEIGPDWAVGRVVNKATNGIIVKGDNATTQL